MKPLNAKKILLVHPLGYRTDDARGDISRKANIMPPLGLASIAAYLEKCGIKTAIIDCYARPNSDRLIHDYLLSEKPAFLGLSCTTSSFLDGVRIAEFAKSILPNIQVVFGGAHVSALKQSILEDYPIIDYLVIGEGEVTLTELIENANHGAASSIPGIAYRENAREVCFTGYRAKGINLDTLPFPAYEKLAGYPWLALPQEPPWARSNWQSYWVTLTPACPRDQEAVMQALKEEGIHTRRGVMCAHREPAYRDFPLRFPLPVSEYLQDRSIILPLYPGMTDSDQNRVIAAFLQVLGA